MRMTKLSCVAVSCSAILILVVSTAGSGEPPSEEVSSQLIKRTLTNMWGLALAAEGHRVFHGSYPSASTVEELAEAVRHPWYVSQEVPLNDAWGNRFLVISRDDEIEIRSVGSDGILDDETPGGMTSTLVRDIVIRSREYTEFIQYPIEYCDQCPPNFCERIPSDSGQTKSEAAESTN